jgi:hypothetical protein
MSKTSLSQQFVTVYGPKQTYFLITLFVVLLQAQFVLAAPQFTEVKSPFPSDVVGNNMLNFADIDGDGDQDAFINGKAGTINYYKNNNGLLEKESANPLGMVDVKHKSAAALVDIDNNGTQDAFIGKNEGTVSYYKNTGNSKTPFFSERTGGDNPLNLVNVTVLSTLTFGDIDNDSDLDAVIGAGDGTLYYYKNNGSSKNPKFEKQIGINNPFNNIDVGSDSVPTLGDIDNDGDLDLFIGEEDEIINYYENTGAAFVERTGANNPLNGRDVGEHSSPVLVDFDNDGNLEVFIGASNGTVKYFDICMPPQITIKKSFVSVKESYLISGTASNLDDKSRVEWQNNTLDSIGACIINGNNWECDISLAWGENNIVLIATNRCDSVELPDINITYNPEPSDNGIFIIINTASSIAQEFDNIAKAVKALAEFIIVDKLHKKSPFHLRDIYYLGPDEIKINDQGVVRGSPEKSHQENWDSLVEWAKRKLELKSEIPLYILLMGHASKEDGGKFLTPIANIFISSDELKSVIERITTPEKHPIYIFIEACYSGIFIENLKNLGQPITTRSATNSLSSPLIITSANALKSSGMDSLGTTSFSRLLWQQLSTGQTMQQAYNTVYTRISDPSIKNSYIFTEIEGFQEPQFVKGFFNKKSLADQVIPFRVSASPPPIITEVKIKKSGNLECHVNIKDELDSVWATIIPPNYSSLPLNPRNGIAYYNLPTIELYEDIAEEAYWGKFNGFVKSGTYSVICYAKNNDGDVSIPVSESINISENRPVTVTLDMPEATQLGKPFKVSRTATGEGEYDEYEAVFFPDGNYLEPDDNYLVIAAYNVPLKSTRVEPFSRKRITLSPEGNTREIVSFDMPNIPTGTYSWYSIFVVPGGNPLNPENWMGIDTKEFEVLE